MDSGIKLKCKKLFGQFLLTEKPECAVNGGAPEKLDWNKEFFIALQPNLPYNIAIQFPYMNRTCGSASISLQLNPNEVQEYEYRTPPVMTLGGSIQRKR